MDPVEPPPTLLRSPWFWSSCFAVAVTLTFFIVFLAYREGRTADAAASKPATAQATAPATLASAMLPTPDAPPASRAIDLLALIDLARDTRGGNWHVDNGALVSDASSRALLAIRYKPPREYDFLIQFTLLSGDNNVIQVFSVDRELATFVLGGWKRTSSGFQHINGKPANANPSTVHSPALHNGEIHTCVIRVRNHSIQAVLDDQPVTSYDTDGSDLSQLDWKINGQPLGFGSQETPTAFHQIKLIPVDLK